MWVSSQRVRPIDVMHLGKRARDLLLGGRRLARRSGPPVMRGHAARRHRRRAPEGPAPDPYPLRPRRRGGRARAPLARPARLRPRARRAASRRPRQARRLRRPPLRRRSRGSPSCGARSCPVPEENLNILEGGETGLEGAFTVEYTPGHASHHVCYLHEPSGIAFVGDMAGVRVPPEAFTLAPTPPPDIDVEKWEASLETIAGWQPQALALTHFGRVDDPPEQFDRLRESLTPRPTSPRSTTRTASSRPTRRACTSRRGRPPTRSSRPRRRTSCSSGFSGTSRRAGGYPRIDE